MTGLDELIKVDTIHFLVEKFLHEIYQFESLKGLTYFSNKVHTETKNRPIQKWYQMCLLNFKSSLIAKEIRVYPLLLSKVTTLETWPTAKKSTFELRQIDFFLTAVDSSWWADQSICHPFFGRKIPSWDIPVWKFKGVDNFSSKVHTETKNRPIPIVRHIGEF